MIMKFYLYMYLFNRHNLHKNLKN